MSTNWSATGLGGVLDEHFWHPPVPNKQHAMAWGGCYCGWQVTPRPYDSVLGQYRDHLAAAIREWLRAELAADGMREYVCDATEEALNVLGWNYGTSEEIAPEAASAARDAIAAKLTEESA